MRSMAGLALTAFGQAEVNPLVSLPAVPDAVEAGVRAGRAQEAAERLAVFRAAAERTPQEPQIAGLVAATGCLAYPGDRRCRRCDRWCRGGIVAVCMTFTTAPGRRGS